MTIGGRIKARRIQLGLSADEVAVALNKNRATVYRYESEDIEKLPTTVLEPLAKVLRTTPAYLMGWADEQSNIQSADELPNNKIFMIPVFDSVSAGFGAYTNELVVDYIPTYIGNACDASNYIRINVKGDSMSPLIDDGSQIIVRKQTSADNGAIAVVLIDDDSAVVKKIKYGKSYFELISINPYYPPRRFEDEDIERIKILGVVKEVRKLL